MNQVLRLFLLSEFLVSCSALPPVSGTVVTERGEVHVHPDGRIEVVIEPIAEK